MMSSSQDLKVTRPIQEVAMSLEDVSNQDTQRAVGGLVDDVINAVIKGVEAAKKDKTQRKVEKNHNLGPANLNSTNVLPPLGDFPIKAKRQDSTQHEVNLMDELCDFTQKHFPKWDQEHLNFPLALSKVLSSEK